MHIYKKMTFFLISVLFIIGCGDIKQNKKATDKTSPSEPSPSPSEPVPAPAPVVVSPVSPIIPTSNSGKLSPLLHVEYNGRDDFNATLFHQQWYLKNNGQQLYDLGQGTNGIDIHLNISNAHNGDGVNILIVDSGIDPTHDNLKNNILPYSSIDFTKGDSKINENPVLESDESHHGTNVGGIIAAKPIGNGFTGIAPNAKIASANLISKHINKNKHSPFERNSLIYTYANKKNFNIINESYGNQANFILENNLNNNSIYNIISNNSRKNDKLGYIIVKAGGNDTCNKDDISEIEKFKNFNENVIYDHNGNPPKESDAAFYFKALRPRMSQFDSKINNPSIISVANSSAFGIINYSSSIGANLWITAFGGGYPSALIGDDVLTKEPKKKLKISYIFTTRIHSDEKNKDLFLEVSNNSKYPLTYPISIPKEYENNYTTQFSGTSAAAPMVSGVIALMLQANPNLSLRDVKYILAKTANTEKINVFHPKPYCIKVLEKMKEFNANFNDFWDAGIWKQNHAGFYFNNYYGFGLIDADKALKAAENLGKNHVYTKKTEETDYIVSKEYEIESIKSGEIKEYDLEVNKELQIEAIQVTPAITSLKADGLGIKIKSPSSTESILLYP